MFSHHVYHGRKDLEGWWLMRAHYNQRWDLARGFCGALYVVFHYKMSFTSTPWSGSSSYLVTVSDSQIAYIFLHAWLKIRLKRNSAGFIQPKWTVAKWILKWLTTPTASLLHIITEHHRTSWTKLLITLQKKCKYLTGSSFRQSLPLSTPPPPNKTQQSLI